MPLLMLGLLVMAATAAFVGLAIAYNTGGGTDYTVNLLGEHPFTLSTLGAFASGLALATIFGLGLWLMLGGGMLARRRSRKQRAARHAERQTAAQRDTMASRLEESGHEEHVPRSPAARERPGATSYSSRRGAGLHFPRLRKGH